MAGPSNEGRTLIVVAAASEGRAVVRALGGDPALADRPWTLHGVGPRTDVLVTGVGKANAAGGAARCFDPARHARVVNLGVAGALPGSGLGIGDAVLATASVFGDEGVALRDRFAPMAEFGFPPLPPDPSMGIAADGEAARGLRSLADAAGVIATISTCAGTDAVAAEVVLRTGAVAEAMEGAAVGLAVARVLGAPGRFCELRVISNTTGDRDRQLWDLPRALTRLGEVARLI